MFRLFLLSAFASILLMGGVIAAFASVDPLQPLDKFFQRPKPRPPVSCVFAADGQMICTVRK